MPRDDWEFRDYLAPDESRDDAGPIDPWALDDGSTVPDVRDGVGLGHSKAAKVASPAAVATVEGSESVRLDASDPQELHDGPPEPCDSRDSDLEGVDDFEDADDLADFAEAATLEGSEQFPPEATRGPAEVLPNVVDQRVDQAAFLT